MQATYIYMLSADVICFVTAHLFHRLGLKIDADMRVFSSHLCDYQPDAKTRLTDHVRVHEKQRDLKCSHCEKLFMTQKARRSHFVKVSPGCTRILADTHRVHFL